MTLLADRIDVGATQQLWIRAAVREVTRGASLSLHHRVFEYKWSTRIGVAICAKRVLPMGSPGWVLSNRAVRVVAVSACNQAFQYLVVR